MSLERGNLYEFGKFRLDTASKRLLHDGQIVALTSKVYDLLVVLVENRGRVVSKDELLKAVWPDTFVEEGNLTQNISVLRKVLAAGATGEEYIDTIPRQGYRFTAPVTESGSTNGETHEPKPARSRWRRGLPAAAILVLIGAGAWFWFKRQPTSKPRPAIDSLVVLPFLNLSSDRENEYFSDGLTEELINSLTRIDGLRVVARTTAFQFKGKAQDIRNIGRQLGVSAVLEGSVRKEQNRLRVTAQLNSVGDGYHYWSETYDRELKDVFAIQEEIAQAIQQRVQLKLGKRGVAYVSRRTPNLEAYNLYLRGRFYRSRVSRESMDKAIHFFEEAIKKQPDYAEAYAALANCYTELGYSGQLDPKEAFPKAAVPLRQALSLDESLAEAHAQQAIISLLFDWNWDAAKREFQRAIALDPANSFAHHWYSHYFVATGDYAGSLAESKRALELDPLDLNATSHLAWHYDYARAYEQAIGAAEKSLEIDANHRPSLVYLEWAFEGAGQFDRAIGTLERAGIAPEQGRALRRAVMASGANGYWRKRIDFAKLSPKIDDFRMAELYAHINDIDGSRKWLDRAFQQRHSWLVYLNSDPAFDGIRKDERFMAIVEKVGLPLSR